MVLQACGRTLRRHVAGAYVQLAARVLQTRERERARAVLDERAVARKPPHLVRRVGGRCDGGDRVVVQPQRAASADGRERLLGVPEGDRRIGLQSNRAAGRSVRHGGGGTRALTGQPGDVRLRELRVEHHHVVHLSFEIIAVLADAEIERLVQ